MAQRIDVLSRLTRANTTNISASISQGRAQERILYLGLKRAFDILLASILLVLLAPFILVLAIIIRVDSSGPAFFAQRRVGKDGRVFNFFKLRSMYQDVDCNEHRAFAKHYINGHHDQMDDRSSLFKACQARQITRIGRFLRKSSIDELPQLLNILKGDMSFVGPRPSIEYELDDYKSWHKKRLAVMPGLTGWAQIHGRSTLLFDEIVSLDLEYIQKRSLLMDLQILIRTIPMVLTGKGAG